VSAFFSFRPFSFLRRGFRNDASPPILTTGARLIQRDGRYIWRVYHCDQCSGQHEHDAGAVGIGDPRARMPWFVAMPCATEKSRWGYYRLYEVSGPLPATSPGMARED
jgi:hypothetical protein